MPEIIASDGGQTGIEFSDITRKAAGRPEERTFVYTGPVDTIKARFDIAKDWLDNGGSGSVEGAEEVTGITSVEMEGGPRGRGRLRMHTIFATTDAVNGDQEFIAATIVRPIYAAQYWSDLSVTDIAEVRRHHEDGGTEVVAAWADKQKRLFGHLVEGYDQYQETYYIFRRSFICSPNDPGTISATLTGINQVVTDDLPGVSPIMEQIVRQTRTQLGGQWLKLPVSIRSLGAGGLEITEEYQWAPAWSVVYGGSFTGV